MSYATGGTYHPRLGYGGSPALSLSGLPVCWQPIDDGTAYPFKNLAFTPAGGSGRQESCSLDRNGTRLNYAESKSTWEIGRYENNVTALLIPDEASHLELSANFTLAAPGASDSWHASFTVYFFFDIGGAAMPGYEVTCGDWGAGGVKPSGWPDGGDGVYDGYAKYRRGTSVTAAVPIPYYATALTVGFSAFFFTPDATAQTHSLSASVYVDSGARGVLR